MRNLLYLLLLLIVSCDEKKEDDTTLHVAAKEKELKEQITKYPDSLILTENLIQYYRDNSNYFKAISETNNAIKRDSSNPRLYDILGILHFENGDTLSAVRSFEKAVDIYPAPEYLISLGTLYAETRNPAALDVADMLLEVEKEKAAKESLFIKGLFHSYNNEKQKAIEYFDKAIALNFTFMEAYREKAIAQYDLGKYNESLATLDKAVTLQNNFDEGYYYRGRALEKLNRRDEAIESYERALLYDPNYIEARQALTNLKGKL